MIPLRHTYVLITCVPFTENKCVSNASKIALTSFLKIHYLRLFSKKYFKINNLFLRVRHNRFFKLFSFL